MRGRRRRSVVKSNQHHDIQEITVIPLIERQREIDKTVLCSSLYQVEENLSLPGPEEGGLFPTHLLRTIGRRLNEGPPLLVFSTPITCPPVKILLPLFSTPPLLVPPPPLPPEQPKLILSLASQRLLETMTGEEKTSDGCRWMGKGFLKYSDPTSLCTEFPQKTNLLSKRCFSRTQSARTDFFAPLFFKKTDTFILRNMGGNRGEEDPISYYYFTSTSSLDNLYLPFRTRSPSPFFTLSSIPTLLSCHAATADRKNPFFPSFVARCMGREGKGVELGEIAFDYCGLSPVD